jgi:hypothetical protein
MSLRRRLPALLAAIAVAWAALLPAVSSARSALIGEVVPLCHQAGTQVPMDGMPDQTGAPEGSPKVHCPLCIMAFYAGFSPAIAVPPFFFSSCSVTLDAYCAPLPSGTDVRLPQSRAPPVLLPI